MGQLFGYTQDNEESHQTHNTHEEARSEVIQMGMGYTPHTERVTNTRIHSLPSISHSDDLHRWDTQNYTRVHSIPSIASVYDSQKDTSFPVGIGR